MGFWQISGESGASLGAGLVDVAAYKIQGAKLRLGSLQEDQFTFNQALKDVAEVAAYAIDGEQKVELWRDGVRFFQGFVKEKPAANTSENGWRIDYTVSGVWWWLQKTPLSGDVNDQTGNTKTRIMYELAEGNLKDHLTTILNRANTLGVPITVGAMDDCFVIPKITLKQMSCADAIAELLRWVPDSMAWIDYSGATPAFRLSRRDTATVATLTAGAKPTVGVKVNPKYELEAEQVTVTYVKRGVDGKTIYMEQISGHDGTAQSGAATTVRLAADASESDDAYKGLTVEILSGTGAGQTKVITGYDGTTKDATVDTAWTTNPDATSVYKVGGGSGAPLKRQLFTVSGPELDSFLPNDYFDTYEGGGTVADTSAGMELFGIKQSIFAEALDAGMPSTQLEFPGEVGIIKRWAQNTDDLPGDGGSSYTVPATVYTDTNGDAYDPSGKYLLIGDNPPDWLRNQLGLVEINIAGWWVWTFLYFHKTSSTNQEYYSLPNWSYLLPGSSLLYSGYTGSSFSSYSSWRLFGAQWSAKAWASSSAIPAGTIYRDPDYSFVNPPEGLAENLRKTQSFVPYHGILTVADQLPGSVDYRGKVLNVANSLPEHATMGAMCQGVDIDLVNGAETIRVGAPQRFNYLGLVNRFRRTASDNIIPL